MSENDAGSGSCLCQSTRIEARHIPRNVGACHCSMCRKWGGGPLMSVDCGTEVILHGEENIGIYDSSEWAQRGFCKKCGSHLFYRLKDSMHYYIPVGFLDLGDDRFVFDHQIFIDKKPSYYDYANDTVNMTSAEVSAKFAPPAK